MMFFVDTADVAEIEDAAAAERLDEMIPRLIGKGLEAYLDDRATTGPSIL